MKKLLAVILAAAMLLSFAACGPKGVKEEIVEYSTCEGEGFYLSAELYHPESYTVEQSEDYPNWLTLTNIEKNCEIKIGIYEDTTYDANKEYDKENEETYTEFKVGKYDAFGYEDFGGYYINMHLEEVSETTDRYIVVQIETPDYSKDHLEGIQYFEDEEIKEIVESITYNGVLEVPEEEETEQ